jgi:hypothetical protein
VILWHVFSCTVELFSSYIDRYDKYQMRKLCTEVFIEGSVSDIGSCWVSIRYWKPLRKLATETVQINQAVFDKQNMTHIK